MKRIQDVDVENKKVLLRVDFNVAVEDGKVKESFKIAAAKETVEYLLGKGARVAMISHLGRPEGKRNMEFSFSPIVDDVESILGVKIKFVSDCIGEEVKNSLNNLEENEVLLLENVRFYEGDEKNEEKFSNQLAEGFDIFVNDSFSASHRDHASVTGVMKFLDSYAGLRLQKEVEEMSKIKNSFEKPAVAIIGGAKIETKLPVIKFFEQIYDYVLVGGKIANEAIDQKIEFSEKVILPVDFIDDPVKSLRDHGASRLDIGLETTEKFKDIISSAKTIVWNGPMGKFEEEKYAGGTNEIFKAIIGSSAYTLVGGGETLEILERNNAMDKVDFVSTGGGAMLEYLGGGKMPGIESLNH